MASRFPCGWRDVEPSEQKGLGQDHTTEPWPTFLWAPISLLKKVMNHVPGAYRAGAVSLALTVTQLWWRQLVEEEMEARCTWVAGFRIRQRQHRSGLDPFDSVAWCLPPRGGGRRSPFFLPASGAVATCRSLRCFQPSGLGP